MRELWNFKIEFSVRKTVAFGKLKSRNITFNCVGLPFTDDNISVFIESITSFDKSIFKRMITNLLLQLFEMYIYEHIGEKFSFVSQSCTITLVCVQ